MKKYLPYILIIVLLGLGSAWFFYNQTTGTAEMDEDAFAVKDADDITKIILTDTDNKKITLKKQQGVWIANDKFEAREELTLSLLDAITRMKILSAVPYSAHDNVMRELMGRNVKTEIFTGSESKPERVYYVGGPTLDGQGTYLLLEKNGKPVERPHIIYIPSFLGYVTHRFNTDEENWRSKVLFRYRPEDIQSLSISYPDAEQNSFTIARINSDSFALSPADEKYRIQDSYRQAYIRQYLEFYSSISIEAFDNDYSGKDSLMKTRPFCILSITDKNHQVNQARLYRMPISKRSKVQFDEKGNELDYDLEHYHAAIHNDKDLAIVQYYVFGKLMRQYKDFYFKPVL